ncbi:beta-lactamase/transpeptidase-like protein [Dendryphion nanum]|uniref:Beta-lactamase/transpeptidase-like protein n=1 Tax=Dendryphion nanum TaxID=256645 RepID=A0A9P9D4Q6_9PLEO|nr:beta-lactamase/transpeptidase-like protein [Dendryphion nanum]
MTLHRSQGRSHTMRSVALTTLSLLPAALAYCPPPGALLPPPIIGSASSPPASTPAIPESVFAPLRRNDTNFAVRASIGNTTIFSYDFLSPLYNVNNTGLSDTQFRIASVGKLYTVLAVLLSKNKIGWEDPIRKYVPELRGKVWDDVTISALAGQTSGLGRFGFVGDLAVIPGFDPRLLGIPPVNNTHPGCDSFPGAQPCNYTQVIDMFNHPSQLPHSPNGGPLYSNIAYNLLGMALEKVHSKTYEEVVADLILRPLGLTKSTFIPPTDPSKAVLPRPGDRWFVPNFENYNPTGGLWSTPTELHKFVRAILDHKLLSPASTRKWLQPRALVPSLHQLVGAPWEILRPTDLNLTFPRAIDIYTKSGGVDGYASFGIVIPEFDLAVSINAAGNRSATTAQSLLGPILSSLIPYADAAARGRAQREYVGMYTLPNSNGSSSITFALDSGPGLLITNFTMNNVPVLRSFAALQPGTPSDLQVRVYPTDPDSLDTAKEFWWMNFETRTQPESFAEFACSSWLGLDRYRYSRESLDAVGFVRRGGRVVGVELGGWRTTLGKVGA